MTLIFCQALGFENTGNLSKFAKNLQLFAYCSHCEDEKVIEIHNEGNEQIISPSPLRESTSDFVPAPTDTKTENLSIDLDLMRHIEDFNRIPKAGTFVQESIEAPHQMNVNYAHILSALEMSIKSMEAENLSEEENEQKKNVDSDFHIDLEERKSQIEFLWENYRKIFPEEHVHTWTSLEPALSDYLKHLKKRQQLHMECDRLRRQNAQLKYMLQELL